MGVRGSKGRQRRRTNESRTWFIRAAVVVTGCFVLCLLPTLASDVIDYQGRLTVAGTNYQGTAQFKFAIVNRQGALLWATLPLPESGSREMLPGAISANVQSGFYGARLGDVTLSMPPLEVSSLGQGASLRIWFKDPAHGWQLVLSDHPLPLEHAAVLDTRSPGPMLSQGEDILRELRAIRLLLERQQRGAGAVAHQGHAHEPVMATIAWDNRPSLGSSNAPLVLVEFTDFQCSYCRQFHEQTFPALKKNYIDTGKLRFVSRNLALAFHKQAEPAAQAALCAEAQKKYWAMREHLFAHSAALSPETISRAATDAGVDLARFKACLDARTFAADVQSDRKVAEAASITGTPTFVLGKAVANGVTGRVLAGAQPFSVFDAEIRKLLEAKP